MLGYVDARKMATSTYRESIEVLAAQSKQISLFGVDEANGRITIPVDEAIKKMVSSAATSKNNEKKSDSNDEA